MPIYDKPVPVLMQEMVPALGLSPGQVFTRDDAVEWFRTNYPLVKQGTVAAHLIRLSTNNKTAFGRTERTTCSFNWRVHGFACTSQEWIPIPYERALRQHHRP